MNEDAQQELVEHGADFFAVHDLDGTIISVNSALAEYLGFGDPAELLGRNLAEFLAPAVRHLLEPRLADIARSGRGHGLLRLRTRGGEERVVEYHNTLRTKGVPRPVVRAVARDVTAARRQQTILRALHEISQAAFSAANADSLFAALHGIVGELMPARNFFIAFYDPEQDSLSYPYFVDEHDPPPPPGPLGRGLTAYVLRTGAPLLTSPERFAELVERGEVESIGTPALDWLGVPLRTEQTVLGVLAVQSYAPGVRFGETEKQVLSYVSAHIAAAIERLNSRQILRESEERLRLAVKSAGLTIWDWDLARDIIASTPAPDAQAPMAAATTQTYAAAFALVLPEDRPRVQQAVSAAIAARGSFREEFRLCREDGVVVWNEAVGQVHCDAEGRPVRVIGTARDVTERRHTEAALQRRLDFEKLVAALSSRFIAISGHQVDEGIQGALAAIGEFIGADRSYVFLVSPDGAHMANTHEWCAPGIQPEIQNLQRVAMAEFPWFAACMNRFEVMDVPDVAALPAAAAHERAVFTEQGIQSLISVPMVSRDVLIGCLGFDAVRSKRVWPAETLALLRFVGEMLVNALERRRMEERLQHDALHDGLTGLPNRAALLDRIAQAQARAGGRTDYTFAVLYVDLDSFRSVNDSLGHFAGDELLVAVARRLAPVLRPGDTLAAVGGDEFVILLEPVADPVDAERMAQRVREALAGSFTSGTQELFLGAGIGIALSSGGYESPQQILRDAQTALHRAKARGRGRHQIFDQPMHEEARGHFELERDLRAAHERGELLLLYQPIVAVADRRLVGFEALVRWQHPRRGLLLPAQFVPLAEAAGLIMPLGTWILREACAQLQRWQEQRPELTMSVNLSPRQLASPDFEATLLALITAAPAPAASLHLEITENSLLEESAARVLARLKGQGVQIHLDDFGTGYSSLSYLSRLPIDVLKIDRSFLGDLEHAESLRIVRAIVTLARDLALGVIVEGLETEAQFDFVRRLGVELAQGNLLGPPADAADAGRLVAGQAQQPSRR